MKEFYVYMVQSGKMSLEQVPEAYRADVAAALGGV